MKFSIWMNYKLSRVNMQITGYKLRRTIMLSKYERKYNERNKKTL